MPLRRARHWSTNRSIAATCFWGCCAWRLPTAAIILREFGIEYASYREVVAKPPAVPEPDTDAAAVPEGVAAEPLREATAGLRRLLADRP